MKLFYQIIIVHTLFNFYVFWQGWKLLPDKKTYKIPFAGIFISEFLIFLIGFIGGNNLPLNLLRSILIIGFSWSVFIFYMVLSLFIIDIGRLLYRLIKKQKKRFILFRRIYYCASVLLTILLMVWGYNTYLHPSVVEKDIVIYKKAPYLWQLRIVVASDLHIGIVSNKETARKYVTKIMEQNPDIILLPGDIIDYDLAPLIDQHIDEDLKRLKAPYGVYACTGNHEHYADGGDKIKWIKEKTDIILLQDSAVKVADSFYIVGREDRRSPRKPLPLDRIISHIDRDLPIIVLNHRPENIDEEVENNIDMAFYGHTHNGQIVPVNYALKIFFELVYGYKLKGNTHLFVSSGLGVGGPEYRIGTQSEVLVVNVNFSD